MKLNKNKKRLVNNLRKLKILNNLLLNIKLIFVKQILNIQKYKSNWNKKYIKNNKLNSKTHFKLHK